MNTRLKPNQGLNLPNYVMANLITEDVASINSEPLARCRVYSAVNTDKNIVEVLIYNPVTKRVVKAAPIHEMNDAGDLYRFVLEDKKYLSRGEFTRMDVVLTDEQMAYAKDHELTLLNTLFCTTD